jgi:histidinol-phosphatase
MRYFRSSSLSIERKADRSPVTQADRAIEARLRASIQRRCPGESIVGEEHGRSGGDGASYWTIDPIDGTRAFSRGLPSWGIMVSRVEHGRPTLGLCDFPAVDVTIGTAPGVKAYELVGRTRSLLPRPRRVAKLDQVVMFHGGVRWWPPKLRPRLLHLMQSCYLERAYGDCYGYLWALRGYVDIVIDHGVKMWDMAPLSALAQATGRVLVNFQGRSSFSGPDTIMASPRLARLATRYLFR